MISDAKQTAIITGILRSGNMTIDKTIEFFNELECHTPQAKDARDVVIDTMRKYQKREQIVNEYNLQLWNNTSDGAYNFQRIREVIEDGNE